MKQNDRGDAIPKAMKRDIPGTPERVGRKRPEADAATSRSKAPPTTSSEQSPRPQADAAQDEQVAPSAGARWWMERAKAMEGKIAELETKLSAADEQVMRLSASAAAAESNLLSRAESDRMAARTAEARAQSEIIKVMTRLQDANQEAKRYAHEAEWLRTVYVLMHDRPRWWFLMSDAWRSIKIRRRLRRRGLFDADAYLTLYPDVAGAGIDPLIHYISHGLAEGRSNGID
ncbi:hypothetical protein [Sphingomonas sp. VDB2]|uniref:hypothetical protein n=1 Tax=Sphingomonas sp. VDB2 TaxID=3228751 RepID=UPI003A80CA8A